MASRRICIVANDAEFCIPKSSATGTRTRVARVRAEYPNQLDYSGICIYNIPLRSSSDGLLCSFCDARQCHPCLAKPPALAPPSRPPAPSPLLPCAHLRPADSLFRSPEPPPSVEQSSCKKTTPNNRQEVKFQVELVKYIVTSLFSLVGRAPAQ